VCRGCGLAQRLSHETCFRMKYSFASRANHIGTIHCTPDTPYAHSVGKHFSAWLSSGFCKTTLASASSANSASNSLCAERRQPGFLPPQDAFGVHASGTCRPQNVTTRPRYNVRQSYNSVFGETMDKCRQLLKAALFVHLRSRWLALAALEFPTAETSLDVIELSLEAASC
jgi:hypothetical protein